jgi:hypothetical protein
VRKDGLGGEVVSDASTSAPKGSFPVNIEPLDVLHCGFQHRQVVTTLTLPYQDTHTNLSSLKPDAKAYHACTRIEASATHLYGAFVA